MAVVNTDLGRRFFRGVHEGRYLWLSLALIATIVVAPLVRNLTLGVRLVDLLLLGVVVASLRSAIPHRRWLIAMVIMAAIAVALMVVHYVSPSKAVQVLVHLPLLTLLVCVTAIILGDILLTSRVTADTIAGAVAVYLLLGFLFAVLFSLCSLISPSAFVNEVGAPVTINMLAEGFGDAVYFSFVTLTTVGYGDIVPRSQMVKSLSILQAMTGQLYMTILVARLVGMHISLPGDGAARFGPVKRSS